MKTAPPASSGIRKNSWEIITRFVAFSALSGLLLGTFEAAMLRSVPRVPVLLVPDIGFVEWFLAPLLDMVCFGLLGLVLGYLAARNPRKRRLVMLVAADAATVAMFVALRLRWFHNRIVVQEFAFREMLLVPLAWFAAGFAVALAGVYLLWKPASSLAARRRFRLVRYLVLGLALAVVAAACGIGYFLIRPLPASGNVQAAERVSGQRPNIVFIVLDTVRADHLSSYGYSRPTTPNLDRLAKHGVLFENAIAPTSWTLASHASMFTGLLPHQNGADWWLPLRPGPRTLAEILRSRGYTTAGFVANFDYCQKGWGLAHGFGIYADSSDTIRHNLASTLLGTALIQPVYQHFCRFDAFERQDAQQINQEVFRWLHQAPHRPFFVFVNYFDTHVPYLTEPPYDHRFGKLPDRLVHKLFDALQTHRRVRGISAAERATLMAAYDDCLAYLDAQVGRLIDFLGRTPEGRNTIIIVTSDHGEAFGEQGYYSHGYNLYHELLHVPLIIAGPGIPQGIRIRHLVRTRDLFSTVLDLAAGGHSKFSRESLARFWQPGFMPQPFDNFAVSELVPIFNEGGNRAMISLTTPEWQYIYNSNGGQELYRWPVDPLDQTDLARSPGAKATLQRLHQRLVGLLAGSSQPWRDMNYLFTHGTSGTSFLHEILFAQESHSTFLSPGRLFIGASQSFFKPDVPLLPQKPSQPDRESLKSLPYQ